MQLSSRALPSSVFRNIPVSLVDPFAPTSTKMNLQSLSRLPLTLKLNEEKTECLIIGTKYDITKYDELKEVSINNQGIVLPRSVRDLGFVIDNNLTCNEQIGLQTVVKNANFSLRNIAFVKKYLDDDSMKKLAHNYIITRIDYCNSLYHELYWRIS